MKLNFTKELIEASRQQYVQGYGCKDPSHAIEDGLLNDWLTLYARVRKLEEALEGIANLNTSNWDFKAIEAAKQALADEKG